MRIAKYPDHKDFATVDYGAATVTLTQTEPFCTGQFTAAAHTLILVGRIGTGKTHIAIALATTLINNGNKARVFHAVDLTHALIKAQTQGNAGKIVRQLSALDRVIITTDRAFTESVSVFCDAGITPALLDRGAHLYAIIEVGNSLDRFAQSKHHTKKTSRKQSHEGWGKSKR